MLSLSEEVKNPSAGICLYKEHLTENIVDLTAKMFEFSLSTRKLDLVYFRKVVCLPTHTEIVFHVCVKLENLDLAYSWPTCFILSAVFEQILF